MTGASSPKAGFVHGVAAILLLPYAATLKDTPKAALAAVVLAAVGPGVVKPKALLKLHSTDAVVGWLTAFVSVLADPTAGFVAGLALAALLSPLSKAQTTKKAN